MYDMKNIEQQQEMQKSEEFVQFLNMKDILRQNQVKIGGMLKDHFLDYENHCSTTPIEKQLEVLENHILELKNSASSRKKPDHSRSRSRGDKLS